MAAALAAVSPMSPSRGAEMSRSSSRSNCGSLLSPPLESGRRRSFNGGALRANSSRRSSNARRFVVTATSSSAAATSRFVVEDLLEGIKWDGKGLVVAIAQHVDTGAVLMQGFANREAVAATLASNRATFFSRSRSSLWTKGESSGNFINVVDVYLDCDRDSVCCLWMKSGISQRQSELFAHTEFREDDCLFERARLEMESRFYIVS